MSGNHIGGLKTAQTNKELYGQDFYVKLGSKGGKSGAAQGSVKGFAQDRERASAAGKKGGKARQGRKYPRKVSTAQLGDRLFIMNGVDPLRYVNLTKNKVRQYKRPRWYQFKYKRYLKEKAIR